MCFRCIKAFMHAFSGRFSRTCLEGISFNFFVCFIFNVSLGSAPKRKNFDIQRNTRVASGGQFTLNYHTPSLTQTRGNSYVKPLPKQQRGILPQVLHRLQNKEKPIRTTFTLRFGSLKMIFECSIARCDVGLGRAIVQCQKNPLRKPKLSINRAILSAHFSAVKFCIVFFCWIGFFLVLHRLFL